MPSDHLVLCHPLLLPLIFPSIRVFSDELALRHQVAKVLEFQLSDQNFPGSLEGSNCAPGAPSSQHSKISERMTLTKQP